jgi:two-component system cell cycle sensor histidine kinase/response regulator CckA
MRINSDRGTPEKPEQAVRPGRWEMRVVAERLNGLLATPSFGDPEKDRIAGVLNPVGLCVIALMAVMAGVASIPGVTSTPAAAWFIQGTLVALMLVVLGLLHRGHAQLAAAVFSTSLWSVITLITYFMGGINSPTIAVYLVVSVLAGFLWGSRGVVGFSALSILAGAGMMWAEFAGISPEPMADATLWYAWLVLVCSLVVTGALLRISLAATEAALVEARSSERAAVQASREAEASRLMLETREREQAAMAELGQHALGQSSTEAILHEATRVIAKTLRVSWVSVLERLPGGEELLLRSGVGWPDEAIGQARFPMSLATQAGYTLLTGETVVVEEHEREERFPAAVGLQGLGVVSSLSVLIPGEDEAFGVVGVHTAVKRGYSDDDIRFLEGVANLIALAVRRARASQKLRAREEELRHAQKMEAVGRLAGGIAHDFNNLLTAISGYTSFLIRGLPADHPGLEDAEEIRRMTDQAAALTRQILAFSRRQVLRPELIDLNAVVKNAEGMLRRLIAEDVVFSTQLDFDLDPVRADPGQVEQVLLNLAVNARDAMPEGGYFSISTENLAATDAEPRRVCLSVSDSGVGMDRATQARAFDPFFTTKDRFKGTGLGLATVYGIVQQSGGSISLDSEEGRGTSFRIVLPAAEGEVRELDGPPSMRPIEAGSETVLLAEDESTVRRLMRRVLDENGYTVLEAPDGAAALAMAEEHTDSIQLVLTDVIMPGLGGGELVERLKHIHPEARVLYVSGYADDAIGQHGVLTGDAAFLAKPFTANLLAEKVREVLDG